MIAIVLLFIVGVRERWIHHHFCFFSNIYYFDAYHAILDATVNFTEIRLTKRKEKKFANIFFSIWNMNWSSSHHLQWWMKTYLCHFAFSPVFPSSILRSKNFPRLNWSRLPQLEAKPVCGLQLIGLCKIELLGNVCILLPLLRFDRTHLHDIYVSCWFLWANFTWMSLHFVCVFNSHSAHLSRVVTFPLPKCTLHIDTLSVQLTCIHLNPWNLWWFQLFSRNNN